MLTAEDEKRLSDVIEEYGMLCSNYNFSPFLFFPYCFWCTAVLFSLDSNVEDVVRDILVDTKNLLFEERAWRWKKIEKDMWGFHNLKHKQQREIDPKVE